jgi:hypothetical protein
MFSMKGLVPDARSSSSSSAPSSSVLISSSASESELSPAQLLCQSVVSAETIALYQSSGMSADTIQLLTVGRVVEDWEDVWANRHDNDSDSEYETDPNDIGLGNRN